MFVSRAVEAVMVDGAVIGDSAGLRSSERVIEVSPSVATQLAAVKRRVGLSISVCLPARDEEETVGAIVRSIRADLVRDSGLVDEIVVLDDGSKDGTAVAARRAGASVIDASNVLQGFGPTLGKGDVLWRSLAVSGGDLVVWLDADLVTFDSSFVVRLLHPLLTDGSIDLVRGFYDRPADDLQGGGRVTELVAKPLLALLRPDLAHIRQPLGGEYAGRRTLLERLWFEVDFGVEMGLLLDTADLVGAHRITQVDLGTRRHRSRSLAELAPQASAVARALLERCDIKAAVRSGRGLPSVSDRMSQLTECRRPPLATVLPREVR